MPPDPVQIRRATAEDLAAISTIQAASPEAAQWNPQSYLDFDCRVAKIEGSVRGFLVSRQTAPGEREILNMAVAPYFRRQGIARRLLDLELSSARGATWFLEVRASNALALKLYQQLGFVPVGRREEYYENPPDAAIVMRFFSCYCHDAQLAIGDPLP
jgi:[ribosomal protein S18]-alanine N-acetyltransferase